MSKKQSIDIFKRAVCIKLHAGAPGNSKKISSAILNSKADPKMIKVTKKLLESPELQEIYTYDMETRAWLRSRCLPFEAGIHLLPIESIEATEKELKARAEHRGSVLVPKFLKAYNSLVKAAEDILKDQHNPLDYPPKSVIAKEFSFYWQYISFDVPEQLKGVSQRVWEQERIKAAHRLEQAAKDIQLVLREAMLKLVAKMNAQLQDKEGGKPKAFRADSVNKLTEFLANFDFRNITSDVELKKVVDDARALLKGVDTKALKDAGKVREAMQKNVAAMAGKLDKLVVKAGGRKFRLSEDEKEAA